MKKSGTLFIASLFILALFHSNTFAADDSAVTESAAPVVAKRSAADEKKLIELRKRMATARTELNGSRWEVNLKSSDPKVKEVKDTFTFQDGMFKSGYFNGRGFNATNYSVSMISEESERAVWETMLSAKDGIVFIRGEWEKESMRGSITEQLEGGKKVIDYSFSTSARKAIPADSAEKSPLSPESSLSEEASSALVSKESKEAASEVPAFVPGTTDESR